MKVSEENKKQIEQSQNRLEKRKEKLKKEVDLLKGELRKIKEDTPKKTLSDLLKTVLTNFWKNKVPKKYDLSEQPDLLELRDKIKEYKSTSYKLFQIIHSLGSWKGIWITAVALLIILLPLLLNLNQINSWVVYSLGSVFALFKSMSPILNQINASINQLYKYHSELQEINSEETLKWEQKKEKYEREIQQIEDNKKRLEERLLEVGSEIDSLSVDLERATSKEAIYDFISDRYQSTDYRQHLGIINTIRKDFEEMSKAFGPGPSAKLSKPWQLVRENLRESEKPIDRIVLYIDDLDRCARERVVEVLEAVHLLLAFPLFVVIVGVDTRWVCSALADHFKDFLQLERDLNEEYDSLDDLDTDLSDETNDPSSLKITKASVFNYLEKIFQVSYQISALSESSKYTMIDRMLMEDIRETTTVKESHTPQLETEDIDHESRGDEEDVLDPDIELPNKDEGERISATREAEKLYINIEEQNIIKILSPIVGQTPRMLKSYINTYRIIRSAPDIRFDKKNTLNDYRGILVLLALSMDDFQTTRKVFKRLKTENQGTLSSQILDLCPILKETLDRNLDDPLKNEIDKINELPIKYLKDHMNLITQFSFRKL